MPRRRLRLRNVARFESADGAKVRIDAGARVVEVVVPTKPEAALRFGPALARRFAAALLVAADRSEGIR